MHKHVLMLRRNFELNPIKIKFYSKFLGCCKCHNTVLWCLSGHELSSCCLAHLA